MTRYPRVTGCHGFFFRPRPQHGRGSLRPLGHAVLNIRRDNGRVTSTGMYKNPSFFSETNNMAKKTPQTKKSRSSNAPAKAPNQPTSTVPSRSGSAVPSRSVSVAPSRVVSNAPSRTVSNAPSRAVSNVPSRATSPDAQIDEQDADSEGGGDSEDPEAELGVSRPLSSRSVLMIG